MEIRVYRTEDCPKLAELFYDTVHSVNNVDYTEEQLSAWATGDVDLTAWDRLFRVHKTFIAVSCQGVIAGFGDISCNGYLDHLFVHRDYLRKRVGTALCDKLESAVKTEQITTHASITAKPFFEQRGYRVVKERTVFRNGVYLTNYAMTKSAHLYREEFLK